MSPDCPSVPSSAAAGCERLAAASLVVFSDDWGRHPSSCQHLIRELLPEYNVLWVNTIGTRAPRLDLLTARRVAEKLKQWGTQRVQRTPQNSGSHCDRESHRNLTVVNPRMWPWFSRPIDRRLNAWLLQRQLAPFIEALPGPVTAITTLPITADLPQRLPIDRWLYYCVDDFSEWPGLDGRTLRRMDRDMIRAADSIVAVSEHLRRMMKQFGRNSSLLTHGVDLYHWQSKVQSHSKVQSQQEPRPTALAGLPSNLPVAVFWGVVDRRLDTALLTELSQSYEGSIALIGPQQDPDPAILNLPNIYTIPPQPFADLPAIAACANVLLMPYADLPVTRAMQPLKMKEYMATGRPVLVSDLPAVREWSDALDVCHNPDEFCRLVQERSVIGLPSAQQVARQRLQQESWAAKAMQLKQCIQQPPSAAPLATTAGGDSGGTSHG